MKQKKLTLAFLLIILIASVSWCFSNYPRPQTVSKLKYSPEAKIISDKRRIPLKVSHDNGSDPKDHESDSFKQQAPRFNGCKRNIFHPIFIDKETMMARLAAEAAEKASKAQSMMVIKPPPAPSLLQQELSQFKYHGFIMKDGKRSVFISKGKEISVLKPNDKFARKYKVSSLTDQRLILKVTGSGEEIILPLDDGPSVLQGKD